MSLSRTLLRNKHAVWALALAVTILGIYAYFRLPMQLFPDTSPPVVNVITAYPGAPADQVVEDLTQPLEEEFAALEGIKNVRSTSQDNLSVITLEFQYSRPAELAAVDVQNAIARIRGSLPRTIREPQVLRFRTSDRPVITFGIAGKDLVQTRRMAEDLLAPRIQRIPGVAAVDVFGGSKAAVIVEVDRRKLEAYSLPLGKIAAVLRAGNISVPAGQIRSVDNQLTFRVDERAASIHELRQLPVHLPDGTLLRLRDLATVRQASLDDDSRFSIGKNRSIALQVFKADGANTVAVVEQVRAMVKQLGADYPELEFTEGEETASFTRTVVNNLLSNVWQALLLASIIIFLFLGRVFTSLVTAVSMPLSFAVTFALMKMFNVELNMVTLSAVILAVGMVVDASVVVLENIVRHSEDPETSMEDAAVAGTDEVRMPVLAGAATTVIVLVPLLYLGGFMGKTFGPLAQTLLFAFLGSIVVALFMVPVLSLATRWGKGLDRYASYVAFPFRWVMDRVQGGYAWLLRRALNQRIVTVIIVVALFVAGVLGIKKAGMEVLPKMDGGAFFVSLETPPGSSLEQTERAVRQARAVLMREHSVKLVQSQVGFEAGMRSMGSFGVQGATQGYLTVTMTDRTTRSETIWDVMSRVNRRIRRIPGIRSYTVRELGSTAKSTTVAPIVVRISGKDPKVLNELGERVKNKIGGVDFVVSPIRHWRLDQKRMQVKVDRLRAGPLGVSSVDVARRLSEGTDGLAAGDYYDRRGSPIPIRVRYDRPYRKDTRDLLRFPLFLPGKGTSQKGTSIPLSQIATVKPVIGQGIVTREKLTATLEISAFVHGRPLSFVIADVERALHDIEVPRGYRLELTGEKDDMKDAKNEIIGALTIALVAVYLLLVAQFRSFLHPLTVMMSIPLSLTGVAAALWIAQKPVSMPVLVGLILLVGIVVNNSIILIEFVRQRREAGVARREALLAAVQVRFRPIMMTAMSTIVGMIPLAAEWALGAERFSPLAIAVIGGLTASTLLTLVVIPVLYDLFDGAADALKGRSSKSA